MKKNNKLFLSALLIFSFAFPFNVFADISNQEDLTSTEQKQEEKTAEEVLPLKFEESEEETQNENTSIEVISTEETNEFYGISEEVQLEKKSIDDETREKSKDEKDKKANIKKNVKNPYKGENLKKEKPRHYNTVYRGSKAQWEDKSISKKRKKLKESAEKMLGWEYSQEMRMQAGYADCSSFVHLSLMDAGLMPRTDYAFTTYTMPNFTDYLEEIPWDELKVGDIILGDGHVAFYWGEDNDGHPITLESCGRFGVGYGYMMYGGWDFNYTSAWRVKNIDKRLVKKVVPVDNGLVSIWDLVVDDKSLDPQEKSELLVDKK